ncbi:hypothetical protein M501DRAFT_283202 [Patellaria atrata CBS 101060]|uniref:Bacteriophage T5 Orf172 DNA-binding domain-containing protein n=1 Tax=Patellaria atrata CBS 101060 TaxID=1346257 RepID=A0A9P4S6H1_9PEZI|nr:hypothetical protein M501DRAFT_283202 [Patellaria atrata CBS 101060]
MSTQINVIPFHSSSELEPRPSSQNWIRCIASNTEGYRCSNIIAQDNLQAVFKILEPCGTLDDLRVMIGLFLCDSHYKDFLPNGNGHIFIREKETTNLAELAAILDDLTHIFSDLLRDKRRSKYFKSSEKGRQPLKAQWNDHVVDAKDWGYIIYSRSRDTQSLIAQHSPHSGSGPRDIQSSNDQQCPSTPDAERQRNKSLGTQQYPSTPERGRNNSQSFCAQQFPPTPDPSPCGIRPSNILQSPQTQDSSLRRIPPCEPQQCPLPPGSKSLTSQSIINNERIRRVRVKPTFRFSFRYPPTSSLSPDIVETLCSASENQHSELFNFSASSYNPPSDAQQTPTKRPSKKSPRRLNRRPISRPILSVTQSTRAEDFVGQNDVQHFQSWCEWKNNIDRASAATRQTPTKQPISALTKRPTERPIIDNIKSAAAEEVIRQNDEQDFQPSTSGLEPQNEFDGVFAGPLDTTIVYDLTRDDSDGASEEVAFSNSEKNFLNLTITGVPRNEERREVETSASSSGVTLVGLDMKTDSLYPSIPNNLNYIFPENLLTPSDIDSKIRFLLNEKIRGDANQPHQVGRIYILSSPQRPGLLKIGHSSNIHTRKKQLSDICKINVEEIPYGPQDGATPYFRRVERLVHTDLHNSQRRFHCPSPRCKRNGNTDTGILHQEWFAVDKNTAVRTVRRWLAFTQRDPYDDHGELKRFWVNKISRMPGPGIEEKAGDHALRAARWDGEINPSLGDWVVVFCTEAWMMRRQLVSAVEAAVVLALLPRLWSLLWFAVRVNGAVVAWRDRV